jgi:hypothetical protein
MKGKKKRIPKCKIEGCRWRDDSQKGGCEWFLEYAKTECPSFKGNKNGKRQ